MKHYLDQYYYLNINLESLADIFGYNSAYLGRIFRNSVGGSFNSYIDSVMITNAKSCLESTNLKVYEISEKVGFSSYIYFYRKFVKYTGKSPNEYKKHFNENLNEDKIGTAIIGADSAIFRIACINYVYDARAQWENNIAFIDSDTKDFACDSAEESFKTNVRDKLKA